MEIHYLIVGDHKKPGPKRRPPIGESRERAEGVRQNFDRGVFCVLNVAQPEETIAIDSFPVSRKQKLERLRVANRLIYKLPVVVVTTTRFSLCRIWFNAEFHHSPTPVEPCWFVGWVNATSNDCVTRLNFRR